MEIGVSRCSIDQWNPFTQSNRSGVKTSYVKIYMIDAIGESAFDRKLRMLRQLSNACYACSMCDLGMKYAHKNGEACDRDPHVFSNMNPRRVVVVGQNPGWDELGVGVPFVGEAGKAFDREVVKNGLSRDHFYICNVNRCYTSGNTCPSSLQQQRCEPFLAMELNLIKPLLVVALGAVALGALCPGVRQGEALSKLIRSDKYDVPVFSIYHPSPRNLDVDDRRERFEKQMYLLCGLIKGIMRTEKI